MWKDDRLRWKSGGDEEAGAPAAAARPAPRGPRAALTQSTAAKALGIVPLRVWLLVAYLSLLHIVVMVSFTRHHDINALCERNVPVASMHGDKVLP